MRIIAEIGFNHAGDMASAQAMILAAAHSGAQAVKFQTFRASDIVLPDSPHFAAITCGEMDLAQHRDLKAVADECGVEFMSTPFSPYGVELLEKVGVHTYKIASMDVTNPQLLTCVANTGKPVLLSTGMASLSEIATALELLERKGAGPVCLLHCCSDYPAAPEQLNLSVLSLLRDTFQVPVGYSDHYPGIKACLAASFHGATVLETHFTLDTTTPGGDHGHSADPAMLRELVDSIALFETMKGDATTFFRNRPDGGNGAAFRRGIHAVRDIAVGEVVKEEDLLLCRPQHALRPLDMSWVVGMRVTVAIKGFSPVSHRNVCAES